MNNANRITTNASSLRGEIAPLYHRYQGQSQAQPGRITIDPSDHSATAEYSPEIGNAITFAEWHRRILTVSVNPSATGDAIADLLESEEFSALVERICDGHSIEWDGNNNVGRLTDDAETALEELQTLADGLNDDSAEIWNVGDWLDGSTYPKQDHSQVDINGLPPITSATTDDELKAMADTIHSWADAERVELDGDIVEHLESWREWCQPQDDDDDE